MGTKPRFPLRVREGAVVVTIYRNRAASTVGGFVFVVAWVGAEGRQRQAFADYDEAHAFATAKAGFLAQGITLGTLASKADFIELAEIRALTLKSNVPPISAVTEWARARDIAGDHIVEACREWAERVNAGALKRILLRDAVARMIAEKDRAKKQATRTYKSKLKYAEEHKPFAELMLDAITEPQWTAFLERFADPVTRNDIRKRCITLCRWAQRKNHLPRKQVPAIEQTERAKEKGKPIGIISPGVLQQLLELFFQDDPPTHLRRHFGALVVACFCGLRVEEIHGKRENPELRQRWEDIHLARGFLSVSAAKENTPSNRIVHLTRTAVEWLWRAPDMEGRRWGKQRGPVCEINAVTRIRDIAKTHGIRLPINCFRHSWISYRIARTGDKQSTATEAGNSVKEIDRRYRVPLPKELGEAWESVRPMSDDGSTPPPPEDRSG